MLRREASPTETELRLEHSHLINEALDRVITIELQSKGKGLHASHINGRSSPASMCPALSSSESEATQAEC